MTALNPTSMTRHHRVFRRSLFLTKGMKKPITTFVVKYCSTNIPHASATNKWGLAISLDNIGIDVHKISSQVCILTCDDELIE